MSVTSQKPPAARPLSVQQVVAYLRAHPDFFLKNPELLEFLSPPEVHHGGNVVDLQRHMVGKLQTGIKSLKSKYEEMLLSSRDNMSTLHQVHEAALRLIRAPSLEALLEVVTVDLPAVFNVDMVRLALESAAAEFYESKLGEQNASGVSFLAAGVINRVLTKEKSILLIGDASKQFFYGFEPIFADCSGIVESCALLRLRLPSLQKDALMAFGVRIKNHFHDGQGTEMLSFLAQIVEHRLDECLNESGIAHLI